MPMLLIVLNNVDHLHLSLDLSKHIVHVIHSVDGCTHGAIVGMLLLIGHLVLFTVLLLGSLSATLSRILLSFSYHRLIGNKGLLRIVTYFRSI
jgi:hypothetical protein